MRRERLMLFIININIVAPKKKTHINIMHRTSMPDASRRPLVIKFRPMPPATSPLELGVPNLM